jgi:hypothetical protein
VVCLFVLLHAPAACQVSARLPPAVQVLNTAASHRWRADRGSVLQQALAGGAGDVPGTNLDALGAATHQLIDDMEDQQVRGLQRCNWPC